MYKYLIQNAFQVQIEKKPLWELFQPNQFNTADGLLSTDDSQSD